MLAGGSVAFFSEKLQNKEKKIKQLQSPVHQRGMSYTFMLVAHRDNTQV